MQNTCCFNGHGPQDLPWGADEDDVRCVRLKKLMRDRIELLIGDFGIRHFISGMAQGAVIYAAEIVLQIKNTYPVTLECVLPFKEQWEHWEKGQRERYLSIIKQADHQTFMQERHTHLCFQSRDCHMVDRSGTVMAVWNGGPSSGTAITVRYAREKKRDIYIIDPMTLKEYRDLRGR